MFDWKTNIYEGRMIKKMMIVFVIDTSESVKDLFPIINKRFKSCINELQNDFIYKGSLDVGVITFNSDPKVVLPLSPIETVDENILDTVQCRASTDTAVALDLALQLAENRKRYYKETGMSYDQPLLCVLTDGKPGCANPHKSREMMERYDEISKKIKDACRRDKLVVVAGGIQKREGVSADLNQLKKLTDDEDLIMTIDETTGQDPVEFFTLVKEATKALTPISEVIEEAVFGRTKRSGQQ